MKDHCQQVGWFRKYLSKCGLQYFGKYSNPDWSRFRLKWMLRCEVESSTLNRGAFVTFGSCECWKHSKLQPKLYMVPTLLTNEIPDFFKPKISCRDYEAYTLHFPPFFMVKIVVNQEDISLSPNKIDGTCNISWNFDQTPFTETQFDFGQFFLEN